MTAVNRQSLVSHKKSRIYLHCGETITHAAEALSCGGLDSFATRYDSQH